MGVYDTLRARLERAGVRPSIRRGQNFLLDNNQLDFIVGSAGLSPRDVILEVGPGSGFLTRRLALSGAVVLAVELDRGLLPVAEEETAGLPNVFYLQGDILAGKNKLNPEAMARLEELLAARGEALCGERGGGADGPVLKSVSNLPYSAGTPFVMNLLSSPLPWHTGVFLLQKEVADRLAAAPGTENYGTISIAAALAAETEVVRVVGPRAFWPRPKVDSAVVRMVFRPAAERLALNWPGLRRITSAVFGSRRKILKNALKGTLPDEGLVEKLVAAGIDPECRGETLAPEQFLSLAGMIA